MPATTATFATSHRKITIATVFFTFRAKDKLAFSDLLHADETGVNIGGKRHWLHCASDQLWTYFFPHEKRGVQAMDAINIIPRFNLENAVKIYYNSQEHCTLRGF